MSYITTAAGVSQITAGTAISIAPVGGKGNVTVNNAGVTQITAGAGISIAPVGGTGNVTINSTVTATQLPQRTFFVSPVFTDISPFFSTIQNAINAADGVNATLVFIYGGNYQENLTMKHQVFLKGVNKNEVFIDRLSQATIIPTPTITTAFVFGVSDVTLFSATATIEGVRITLGAGSTLTAYIRDVDINLQVGNSSGIIVDNNTSGSNAHRLDIINVNSTVNGTGSNFAFVKPFNNMNIDHCGILGTSAAGSVKATTPTGALNIVTLTRCTLGSVGTGSGLALVPIYVLIDCTLVAPTVIQVNGSELIQFHNCTFIGPALQSPNGGTVEIDFFNCSFESQVADTLFIDVERTTMVVRAFGCRFNNGRIKIGVVNPNSRFVDCVVRNAGGTKSIETASTPSAFLGNFTSDKPIDAGVTQVAGSFNVQTGVAI